ncbi:MAG: hypothetical protein LBP83_05140 [Dysgonamonadaceae bacterium]|nr:hypothetical protein [Dysgonamonadaceae bacterium]
MTTVKTEIVEKQLILANDFFDLLKNSDKENFIEWMYRRITQFDMELNHDFFIFIDAEAVKELAKYESFKHTEDREKINNIIG